MSELTREEIISIIATELSCSEMMFQYDDFMRTVKGGVWGTRIYEKLLPAFQDAYDKGFSAATANAYLIVDKYKDAMARGDLETSPKTLQYVAEDVKMMNSNPLHMWGDE